MYISITVAVKLKTHSAQYYFDNINDLGIPHDFTGL